MVTAQELWQYSLVALWLPGPPRKPDPIMCEIVSINDAKLTIKLVSDDFAQLFETKVKDVDSQEFLPVPGPVALKTVTQIMKQPTTYLAQKLAAQRLMFLVCVTQIPVIAYGEPIDGKDTFPVDIIFPMLMFMCVVLLCLAVCVTAKCLSKFHRWFHMLHIETYDQAMQTMTIATTTTTNVMIVPRSSVFHTHMCEAASRASVIDHRRICLVCAKEDSAA